MVDAAVSCYRKGWKLYFHSLGRTLVLHLVGDRLRYRRNAYFAFGCLVDVEVQMDGGEAYVSEVQRLRCEVVHVLTY